MYDTKEPHAEFSFNTAFVNFTLEETNTTTLYEALKPWENKGFSIK